MLSSLSVREKDVGGGLLAAVDVPPSVITASTMVVLIHGYNNTRQDAATDYESFARQTPALGTAGQVCAFFWPGDRAWGPVSSASYPVEIKPAKASAALLAGFLSAVVPPGPWPLRVILICHSLGSRVGLELMAQAFDSEAAMEFQACLMAAAVPVRFVEECGPLRRPAEALRRVLVLHSRSDLVLGVAFRVGETLAFEGWFPEAVGWAGGPSGFWGPAAVSMPGYGHASYWPRQETAARVTTFLGKAGPREVPNSVPLSQAAPIARTTPSAAIGTRSLPIPARSFAD
jgi:hypothetical protein